MSPPAKISGSNLRVKNATPENDTWVAQMMQGGEPPLTVSQFFFRQNTDSADVSQDSGKIICEILPLYLRSRPGRAPAKALGHGMKWNSRRIKFCSNLNTFKFL
jgi:hypothetical protein